MIRLSPFIGKPSGLLVLAILCPCSSIAQEQYFRISFEQATTDFFAEENREFKPAGSGISYGFDVNDDWSVDLSYQQSKGDGRWLSHRAVIREFYEVGEFESKSYGLSFSWIPADHGLRFSYSKIDNTESSTTYLPFLEESVDGSGAVLNIGYLGQWIDSKQTLESIINEDQNYWAITWGLGVQSIDSEIDVFERPNTDPPIQIDINLERQSLSAFADVGLSYIFVKDTLSWSPFLNLSWNWELNVSGEEYILLSRGEQSITFEQSGARFNNQIRTPDAGNLELGVSLFWETGDDTRGKEPLSWSLDFSFSEALDAEVDYSSYQISIRVDF